MIFIAILGIVYSSTRAASRQSVRFSLSDSSTDSGFAFGCTSISGTCMPKGDIAGWKQIFSDDFTTDVPTGNFPKAVASKWFAYPDGWKDTSGKGTYYPSKVLSQHNGVLDFFIHSENGVHMVSAPEPILASGTHDYGVGLTAGRYEVRAKADSIACYKRAWMLWPDSGVWPRDGEIDFPEGNLTSGSVSMFMHNQNGTSGSDQQQGSIAIDQTQWHTYTMEWRPDTSNLKAWVDGTQIANFTTRVPNTPMHYVMQTETSLDGCTPADTAQGHILVDWFTAYKPL